MHNIIDEKFWLAIAFFAFVVLILKYVWPILSQKISEQSNQVARDLFEAKELKKKAEELLADVEKKHKEACKKSEELLVDAKNEAKKYIAESKKVVEQDIARKMAAMRDRIESSEKAAIRDIKIKIVDSAFENVESALKKLDKKGAEKIVKNSIEGISKIIH